MPLDQSEQDIQLHSKSQRKLMSYILSIVKEYLDAY